MRNTNLSDIGHDYTLEKIRDTERLIAEFEVEVQIMRRVTERSEWTLEDFKKRLASLRKLWKMENPTKKAEWE